MTYRNVYRATFDLVVNGRVEVRPDPVNDQLIVALDFEEAYEIATAIRGELRLGAVHKDTQVRDLTLVHANVVVVEDYVQAGGKLPLETIGE